MCRPRAGVRGGAGGEQQRSEQSLTAAEIENDGAARQKSRAPARPRIPDRGSISRVQNGRQSAPPPGTARSPHRGVSAPCSWQRRPQRDRLQFPRTQRSSSRGSTSKITGTPFFPRAALPSCSSKMSPACRDFTKRAWTASASEVTVSNPRRVQLASRNCRRDSTGSRNGLRSPAGARKKHGALPVIARNFILRAGNLRAAGRLVRGGRMCGGGIDYDFPPCGRTATICRTSSG